MDSVFLWSHTSKVSLTDILSFSDGGVKKQVKTLATTFGWTSEHNYWKWHFMKISRAVFHYELKWRDLFTTNHFEESDWTIIWQQQQQRASFFFFFFSTGAINQKAITLACSGDGLNDFDNFCGCLGLLRPRPAVCWALKSWSREHWYN